MKKWVVLTLVVMSLVSCNNDDNSVVKIDTDTETEQYLGKWRLYSAIAGFVVPTPQIFEEDIYFDFGEKLTISGNSTTKPFIMDGIYSYSLESIPNSTWEMLVIDKEYDFHYKKYFQGDTLVLDMSHMDAYILKLTKK